MMKHKIKFLILASLLFTQVSYAWEDIKSGMGILASNDISGKHQVILYCTPDSGIVVNLDEGVVDTLEINGEKYDNMNEIANKIDHITSLKINGYDIPTQGLSQFAHLLINCQTN